LLAALAVVVVFGFFGSLLLAHWVLAPAILYNSAKDASQTNESDNVKGASAESVAEKYIPAPYDERYKYVMDGEAL